MILAITMCMSIRFYNLAILIAFSHDRHSIDSNFFLVPKAPDPRATYAPRFAFLINIASGGRKSRSFSRTRRKNFGNWV